jgi:hypothetical protein
LVLSELTFTCACLFHPDFVAKRWQIWLLFQLYNLIYFFAIKYLNTVIGELNTVGSEISPSLVWMSEKS